MAIPRAQAFQSWSLFQEEGLFSPLLLSSSFQSSGELCGHTSGTGIRMLEPISTSDWWWWCGDLMMPLPKEELCSSR